MAQIYKAVCFVNIVHMFIFFAAAILTYLTFLIFYIIYWRAMSLTEYRILIQFLPVICIFIYTSIRVAAGTFLSYTIYNIIDSDGL